MSFHETACDIHLSPDNALVAICNNEEGSGLTSEIQLDDFLGNKDGHFVWGGKNVTQTSRNLRLIREGPSRLPILHADLQNSSGKYVGADCHLHEGIININGELLYHPMLNPEEGMEWNV
ncbi:hypothetical protein FE257_004492 [Aspergillus nanangensis]|uniref:Cyanovirin-N domain-containing protein n=1 Tax=Aspergillus nanangensis TaxID=2582783 RepID=A0AAD4CY51_ASPNN|nr:hypothetical protein FE257_004492 [Aspergillus nanangensis]